MPSLLNMARYLFSIAVTWHGKKHAAELLITMTNQHRINRLSRTEGDLLWGTMYCKELSNIAMGIRVAKRL
jgi:hypothetical protein